MKKLNRSSKKKMRSSLRVETLEQRQLLAGITGGGTEVGSNIVHGNGNIYDQVLMTGSSVTVTADPTQVTRVSFLDLSGDIVQVEFSGAGSLNVSLDSDTFKGPAEPTMYNQPGVKYVSGLASLTITGSDSSTNVSVFTVGTATAHRGSENPLFNGGKTGGNNVADIQRLTIVADPANTNGSAFGRIGAGNAAFGGDNGVVGISAVNVQVQTGVVVGEISTSGTAIPTLIFGKNSQFGTVTVAGGDLLNAKVINSGGSVEAYKYDLLLSAGGTSGGTSLPAADTYAQLQFSLVPASVEDAIANNPPPVTNFTVTATQIVQNNAITGSNAMSVNAGNAGTANVILETDAVSSDGGFIVSGNAKLNVIAGGQSDQISVVGSGNNSISTGGGDDSVTLYTSGTNTVNLGTGSDYVTGGSGNDTVVFASGDFNGSDGADLGAGTDTVVLSGSGNVATSWNLIGAEKLELNGASVTIDGGDLTNYITGGLTTVMGQAGTTNTLVLESTAGGSVNLAGLSVSALNTVRVDAVGGAGNVSLTLTADQINGITSLSAATGDTLTVNTSVAGFQALGTKAGTATVVLTDTLENLLAAGTSIQGLSATITGALSVADAKLALGISSMVKYTISDSAANLALGSKGVFDKATKITATSVATAGQAAAIDSLLDTSTFIRSSSSLVYSVTDTAELLATQTSGLGDATNVTATSVATAKEAAAIAAGAAAGSVTTKASYSVSDTFTNISASVGVGAELTGLNSAASVTISDKVTDVVVLQSINAALLGAAGGLTKVAAGYTLEEQYSDLVGNQTEANAAGAVTVTGTLNVTEANTIEALSNSGANKYTIADSTIALLGASSVLVDGATAVSSNSVTLTASELNSLAAKFGSSKFVDTSLTVVGTAAELATLSSGAIAEIASAGVGGSLVYTVGSKASLADIVALRTALGTANLGLLPAYTVTDTVANLTAGADITAQLAVLNSAAGVVVSDAATVSQVSNLNAKLLGAVGGLATVSAGYTLTDSAANLAAVTAGTDAIVDNAAKVNVSGNASVSQATTIVARFGISGAAAVLGTDVVYTLRDSASTLIAGGNATIVDGATGFSTSTSSVSVATADALLAKPKFDKVYAVSDTVAVLKGSGAPLLATLAGATSVTLRDSVANIGTADGDLARARAGSVTVNDSLAALTGATDAVKSAATRFEINGTVDIATDVAGVNALSTLKSTIYTIAPASNTALNSTAAGVATFVANAAGVSVTGTVTVAQANTLLGKVTGAISYDVADTAANLANATSTVLSKDLTGATISGSTVVDAAQAAILNGRTIVGYTISDTAANISAATSTVVLGAAGGVGSGVTITDAGQANLSVAVAAKVYGAVGQSAGNYIITDTAANLAGANASLVGFSGGASASTAATAAQANAIAVFRSMGTTTYDVSDTAGNLANPANAAGVNAARNLSVSTGTATVAEAVAIQAATNSGSVSYAISDDATNLVTNGVGSATASVKANAIAAVEGASGTVTVTGTVTAAQAVAIAPLTKVVAYSISDTAAGLGASSVTAAALSEANNITVTDTASAALATTLITAGNAGIVTIATVSDTSANLAAVTKASDDVITNVTATSNSTVAQATAIVALGASAGTKTYTLSDTAANLAAGSSTLLANAGRISGATVDIIVSDAASIEQASKIRTANSDVRYSISDTLSNLMANSDVMGDVDADAVVTSATKVTVSDGALTGAQAGALLAVDPVSATKYVFSIVDNDAGLVSTMVSSPASLLAATSVMGSQGMALTFKSVAGSIALVGTPATLATYPSEFQASTVRQALVVDVAELNDKPLVYSTLPGNKVLWVKDTYANLASGNALVAAAAAVEVTDAITVSQAATVNAFLALPADTLYNLADTAANLAAGGAPVINLAGMATATTDATFAQAATISAATAKLSYNVSGADTTFNAAGLAKATNITVTGTAGLSAANAALALGAANTGTTTIAKVVGSATDLAALTKGANDTVTTAAITANTAATVAQAVKLQALATTATYALNDTAANLAAAASTVLNGAANNGTAKAIIASSAATVAQASTIDAATPANADTVFAISDSAANLLAADVALLARSSGTIAVSGSTITAGDATSLRSLDTANTTFAIDVAVKAIKDTGANLLLSANAAAVTGSAGITVEDAVTVANASAIKTLAGVLPVTYSLSDTFNILGLMSNLALVNGSVNVTVNSNLSVAQAAIADSWTNSGTLGFTITDNAASLAAARLAASPLLTSATSVTLTGNATVAQAAAISEIGKLTGGYAISDTPAQVYSALNSINGTNTVDRGSLLGATSIALNTSASITQVIGATGERGLSSIVGLSYRINDTASALVTQLGGANASKIIAASEVTLSNDAGITVAQYNTLVSNLGAAFKAHDHDNSSSTVGRYYITDSSENLVRAASSVITGATTLVVRDTFSRLITNFSLADVKAVLSLSNVNVEITDASLTAAQYTTLDSENGTGTISGPANLTGTAADLIALGGGVLGHPSRTSITVTGATAAAADLIAIDAAASAPVNATAVGTITGNGADLVNAIDDQATLDTAADVVLNVTSGTVTVAQANLLANASTGIVTATISDNAIATLNGLIADSVVNAYTVTVTGTAGATDLLALDAKTSVNVSATGVTNLTGTIADINSVVAAGGILSSAASNVTLDAAAFVNATLLIGLDTTFTGAVNATAITSIVGTVAELLNATDNQATLDTAANVGLILTSASATAADLNTLDSVTTGTLDAFTVTTLSGTAAAANTAYAANGTGQILNLGNESVTLTDVSVAAADLNTLNANTSGTIDATTVTTITGTASAADAALSAAVGEISGLGNEAVTLSDASLGATALNTLNGKTTGVVNAGSVTTLTGASADVNTAYAAGVAGEISGLGNEAVTLSDATLAATVLSTVDSNTSGVVNAGSVTTLTGTIANVAAVYAAGVGAISGLGDEAVTISDASATAVALTSLDGLTSGVINAATVLSVSGSTAAATTALQSSGLSGLGASAVTIDDTNLGAAALNTLESLTTGVVNASTVTNLTGTIADVTSAYNANAIGQISGLGNETATVSDAGITALDLNTLDKLTSGLITATAATTISGTIEQLLDSTKNAGAIAVSASVNLTATNLSALVADINTLDSRTTGQVNVASVTTLTGAAAETMIAYTVPVGQIVGLTATGTIVLTDTLVYAADLNQIDGYTSGTVNAPSVIGINGSTAHVTTALQSAGITGGTVNAAIDINDTTLTAAALNTLDGLTAGTINAATVNTLTGSTAAATTALQSTGITGLGNENITIDDTSVGAANLNTLDGLTTGIVDATSVTTLTGAASAAITAISSGGITNLGNEAVTLNDVTLAAATLNTLDGLTTGTINAGTVTTLTGSTADATTAYNSLEISGLGNEAVTLTDGTLAASALNTLDGKTSGTINASSVTTLTGSTADATTAYNSGEISGLGNEAVTINDVTLAASALNTLDGKTSGTINASTVTTLTGSAAAVTTSYNSLEISNLGNEAVTLSDTNLAAADLNTLDGKTSGTIDATTLTTLTGTTADVTTSYNSLQISNLGNEAVVIQDLILAAADLNTLDTKTSGTIDATSVTTLTGTTAVVTTAYNSAGISNLGNEAVTISDTTLAAADLNTLDGKTSGIIDATTVTTLTGTTAVVTTAYNSAGISNLGNEAVTISDTTLAAADLNTLDGKTSGTIDASSVTTLTGAAADLLTTYGSGQISGLNDEAVTVTDVSVAAANLNTLDGFTSGVVNATAATTITGTGGQFGTLVAAQASGRVTMSPGFDASITGLGTTVAQAAAVDNVTTGTVTTADLVDTYTAIGAAATTVINPATAVTANGTGASQAIDMSVLGRGVTIFGLGGNDTITGTSFADSIEGGTGLDSLTGGLGSDTFVLTDPFAASIQTITDFATGGAGDVLQVDISDFSLAGSTVFIGNEGAVDVNGGDEIIVLTSDHANDAAAAAAVAGTVNVGGLSAVIVYFNNTTNVVHVIRVSDTDTGAGVVHVATLANLTSLISLTGGAVAGNFTPRP
jgi:hypothetical protein